MPVPYSFGSATSAIPLSQLDSNFATAITLGNTAIQLGNTVTTLNNMTLANVTISTGNVTITNVSSTNETISGNLTLSGGTANSVVYLNGSKVATTGAALTFDGTNFAITGTSTATKLIPTGNVVTGNGMYLPAANTLAWSTNGTEGMRLDSSQNLGLGVTPTYKLDTFGTGVFGSAGGITLTTATNTVGIRGSSATTVGSAALHLGDNLNSSSRQWAVINGYTAQGALNFLVSSAANTNPAISGSVAMTLDTSGNLGVGAVTPSTWRLDVKSAGTGIVTNGIRVNRSSVTSQYGVINYESGIFNNVCVNTVGTGCFWNVVYSNDGSTVASTPMTLDSSGNLLVGTTNSDNTNSAGVRSFPNGAFAATRTSSSNTDTNLIVYSTGAAANRFYVGMGGTVYATSTTITGISDVRLKENIRDLDDGLAKVMALQPRKFDWKEGKGANIKDARGFIAQEFEQVFPDMIEQWLDEPPEGEEPYKAVNANLIPTLVKAIQEQQQLIAQLQADVKALKGKA